MSMSIFIYSILLTNKSMEVCQMFLLGSRRKAFPVIVLIMFLLVTLLPTAIAESPTKISVTNASGKPGSEVTVSVQLNKAENIGAMNFWLEFDKEVLSLENGNSDIVVADLIQSTFSSSNNVMGMVTVHGKDPGKATFLVASSSKFLNTSDPVILCTIKFKIADNAAPGNYNLSFVKNKTDIFDDQSESKGIPITISNGLITVTGSGNNDTGGGTSGGGKSDKDKDADDNEVIYESIEEIIQKGKNEIKDYYNNMQGAEDTDEVLNIIEKNLSLANKYILDITNTEIIDNKLIVYPDKEEVQSYMIQLNSLRLQLLQVANELGFNAEPEVTAIIQLENDLTSDDIIVKIPIELIGSAKNTQIDKVSIDTNMASITFYNDFLDEHIESNSKDIEFIFSKLSSVEYYFKITIDGKQVTNFPGSKLLKLSFKYNILEEQIPDRIIVYYSENDNLYPIKNCVYDESLKKVFFTTNKPQLFTVGETNLTFNDIQDIEWAKVPVEALAGRNIISGTGDGLFSPDRNVTREEFAKMIIEAFDLEIPTATTELSDVAKDAWYYTYVASANQHDIVKGIGNNNYGVGTNISRQDMATMAYRAAKISNLALKKDKPLEAFLDDIEIADYAKESVSIMQQAGIISGIGDKEFAPNNNATRAQAARIIYLLYKEINK